MNRFLYKFLLLTAWLCLPLLSPAAPAKTAPKATNSAPSPESFKSVFVMPKTPKEGRDPFFPKATSLYGSAVIPGAQITSVASLKLVGFMGKDLATINNKPFAVGETQEVKTL